MGPNWKWHGKSTEGKWECSSPHPPSCWKVVALAADLDHDVNLGLEVNSSETDRKGYESLVLE
jgi:hypothetical protein